MKLLTINSSGCGDPSNTAFYWLPRGYIHRAWIPPNSPSACSTGRVAAVGGEPGAGSRWESLSTGALGGTCEHPLDKNRGQLLLCGWAWAWFSWTSKGDFFSPASDIYKIYCFVIFFRNVLLFPYVCEPGSSRSPERSASAIVFP